MRECLGNNDKRIKNDFYTTSISCVLDIIKREKIQNKIILENSAGLGNISNLLKNFNNVYCIDLIDRGAIKLDYVGDFLKFNKDIHFDLAVYNPPFKLLLEFINHTWNFTNRQIIFQRLQFLETKKRFDDIFSKGYLEKVYVYKSRQIVNDKKEDNSVCYCWYVLDKKNKKDAIIKWI